MTSRCFPIFLLLLLASPASFAAAKEAPARGVPSNVRQLIDQGIGAFNERQYDKAIEYLTLAYELKPLPTLLYNIAQAHRMAGRGAEALTFFEKFMLAAPYDPLHHKAETQAAELRAELRTALQTHVKVQAAQRERLAFVKWVVGGLGLAATLAGATLWGLHGTQTCARAEGQQQCAMQLVTQPSGIGLTAAGGALLIGAGTLFLLERREKQHWASVMDLTLSIRF